MPAAPKRAVRAGTVGIPARPCYDERFLELFRDPPFLELLRDELFRELVFRDERFRGTFAPLLRASERPIAIACLRLFTLPPLPPRPLFSVPFLRRRIALATVLLASRPYFRLPDFLPDFFLAAISPPCVTGMFDSVDARGRCKHDAAAMHYARLHPHLTREPPPSRTRSMAAHPRSPSSHRHR